MGKNNRARRAAKAKAKAASSTSRTSGAGRPTSPPFGSSSGRQPSDLEQVTELLQLSVSVRTAGDDRYTERHVIELCRFPIALVRRVAAQLILSHVARAWNSGWQPAELVRQTRRSASAAALAVIRLAVVADHAPRDPASLDPRWSEQLAALDLPTVTEPGDGAWLGQWSEEAGLGTFSEVDAVVEAMASIAVLPRLEELIPPPGGSTRRSRVNWPPPVSEGSEPERAMLGKIRALLAKAESTTFEAEAEALTAKAQELMTRHAIDAAIVASERTTTGEEPIAIRVAIDDPYIDAKSLLLQVVATAGRCRAVFDQSIAASTVVGFRTDVIGFELLYTSLLVQAQTSLTNAAKALPAGSRQRSRSFRSSFLLAYANRIGQRLQDIGDQVVAEAEAEHGHSVLPVLRSREVAVTEAVEQRFPTMVSKRVRGGHDPAGWASGVRAADDAAIVAGALPGT